MNKQNLSRFPSFGWWVMLLLAILLFLVASPYLSLNPEVFFTQQRPIYEANLVWIIAHIAGSMIAIITGPFQFLPQLRTRWLNAHRWLGRVYLLGVVVGGIGGLYMAFFAYGGWVARVGFLLLAIVWLYSAYMAYSHIRRKEIEAHRQWMIRNYALTFAGVTLRLGLVIFGAVGLEYELSYMMVAWLSWIPNLLIVEWVMRQGQTKAQSLIKPTI
jgi:uncharacterized membrane protein